MTAGKSLNLSEFQFPHLYQIDTIKAPAQCQVGVTQETRQMLRAKERGLLAGNKRENGANVGRLGSQLTEVKTRSVVLRAGCLSAKTHEG